jgi:polar amino acid transport system substrate-binding protein
MQGSETLPYIMAQEPNTFHLIGEPIRWTLMGIATAREEAGLRDALAQGLRELVADGSYKRLLDKWSLGPNAVPEVTIDAGR